MHVLDGHLECVNVAFKKKPSKDEILRTWKDWNPLKGLELPSAPENPIIVREELNRPQPRYDRGHGNGMTATVGRLREDTLLDYKFVVLSHNTIRGAAGCAILNAELMVAKKLI